MTISKFMEEMKNETNAITFIIQWNGWSESYTKEEVENGKLNKMWGLDEVERYMMLNTREMVIRVK